MTYHKWSTVGDDIYQCPKCGLYRCHGLTNYITAKLSAVSKPRLVDVEFSTVRGSVVALNPKQQPPCEEGIYA